MSYRSKLIIAISNTHTHTTVDGLKYPLLCIPFPCVFFGRNRNKIFFKPVPFIRSLLNVIASQISRIIISPGTVILKHPHALMNSYQQLQEEEPFWIRCTQGWFSHYNREVLLSAAARGAMRDAYLEPVDAAKKISWISAQRFGLEPDRSVRLAVEGSRVRIPMMPRPAFSYWRNEWRLRLWF